MSRLLNTSAALAETTLEQAMTACLRSSLDHNGMLKVSSCTRTDQWPALGE
jgi:hypothetical protein